MPEKKLGGHRARLREKENLFRYRTQFEGNLLRFVRAPFSSPEPTILLACGRNRELWEQPFQACAIDAPEVQKEKQYGGADSQTDFDFARLQMLQLLVSKQSYRFVWR